MFSQYKWYIYVALFVAYSLGVWHVSSKYQEADHLKDQVAYQEQYIKDKQTLQDKADKAGADLATLQQTRAAGHTLVQKETIHEIEKPVYRDCTTPADGMRILNEAINNANKASSK